jgi:hypothetical protein
MRWEVAEIREFLRRDPLVRMLFVEGNNDIISWRFLVPTIERRDSVVYASADVNLAAGLGGDKARLLKLAAEVGLWPESARVSFFVDADVDRILGFEPSPNVVLTDGRDLESYLLDDELLESACRAAGGSGYGTLDEINGLVTNLVRPVGLLRLATHRRDVALPFQRTFEGGSISRFFHYDRRRGASLRIENMVDALLDRTGFGRGAKPAILAALEEEAVAATTLSNQEIVHGKDLIALLSWWFEIPYQTMTGIGALSLGANSSRVCEYPNIGQICSWLRGAV